MRGRLKDIYFDGRSWRISHFVAAVGVPREFDDLKLLSVADGLFFDETSGSLQAPLSESRVAELPSASTVKPVCKQYESLGFGSPASRPLPRGTNPHLRSWRNVRSYSLEFAGETVGKLADMLVQEDDWAIHYLQVSNHFEGKTLKFHIAPGAVERISFAKERLVLKYLDPVHLESRPALFDHAPGITAA